MGDSLGDLYKMWVNKAQICTKLLVTVDEPELDLRMTTRINTKAADENVAKVTQKFVVQASTAWQDFALYLYDYKTVGWDYGQDTSGYLPGSTATFQFNSYSGSDGDVVKVDSLWIGNCSNVNSDFVGDGVLIDFALEVEDVESHAEQTKAVH